MDLDRYFSKNKKDVSSVFSTIFDEINTEVMKYENGKPILSGKIQKYDVFLKNKHLPEKGNNIDDVLKDYSSLFQRSVIWEHPGAMINITPPANLISIVASAYASLYNPNFAQDESSGYLMTTELLVSKYLCELVGWNFNKANGIFTFGGKGTNLYAVKIGLNKAIPNIINEGVLNNKILVFSSEKGHPCHREVCDWLGLGKSACKRIKTNFKGQIDINELEKELRDAIEQDIKIGCIILNGGTTNEIIIDPIKKVVELRNKLVKEYNLSYCPHIHVDSVIGWAWLFFKNYDFKKNDLKMSTIELKKIRSMKNKIKQLYYADSFGADFHKTGFCPYISSIFMSNNYNDVTMLGNKKHLGINNLKFGEYSPFEYTLELTRSSIGPISAYIALEIFGVKGYQKLIYNLFSNSEYIRNKLSVNSKFEVLNNDTEGIATLFIIKNQKYNQDFYKMNKKLSLNQIKEFIDYNHQFYLFCLNKLEKGEAHFKMTYSKSYKPFYSDIITGALKIYPTSPIVSKKELDNVIEEIVKFKDEFDKSHKIIIDNRNLPSDFVYRQ